MIDPDVNRQLMHPYWRDVLYLGQMAIDQIPATSHLLSAVKAGRCEWPVHVRIYFWCRTCDSTFMVRTEDDMEDVGEWRWFVQNPEGWTVPCPIF